MLVDVISSFTKRACLFDMGFEGRVVRVMYPKVFPAVDYVNCRDYPNLRVTKSCPFPGLMVEVIIDSLVNNSLDPSFTYSEPESYNNPDDSKRD